MSSKARAIAAFAACELAQSARMMPFLPPPAGGAHARGGAPLDGGESGSELDDLDEDELEEWMPPHEAPRGFRRVLR
ncbi:MAG: hypothetical protein QGF33_13965, partial [Alphaproteobacteria bacterium]|nr:hypothetical protein [Alphaproteobacteria bacterium]